jgi:CP family cyanate transporter-like MFS transporter
MWLLALAIVLTGLNLRTAVTTVGPLLAELEHGLGMSSSVAGLLTTLPVVCFAGLGVAAPAVVRRFGEFATLGAALAVMTFGLVARALAGSSWVFLLMSVLALTGGAVGNVVLPGVVKRYFPNRTGLLVAAYTTALALGQGAGTALAVPIAQADGAEGWRFGIGGWALVSAAAVVPWVALLVMARGRLLPGAPSEEATADGERPSALTPRMLAHSKLVWALTVFFGCQSAWAYIAFGWIAQFFRDAGVSAERAGLLAAFISLLAIPVSLVVPPLATRLRTQRSLLVVLVGASVAGYAGMLVAPVPGAWLWMTLVGIGLGLFPLAITLIALRTRTAQATAALSAFSQGVGYLIAASGPLLVGILRDATGGWNAPFVVVFALAAVMLPVGWYAAGDRYVDDELDLPAVRQP